MADFNPLRANIQREKELVREISGFANQLRNLIDQERKGSIGVDSGDKDLLLQSIGTLVEQLKIINSAIPGIVNAMAFYKKLDEKNNSNAIAKPKKLMQVSYENPTKEEKVDVIIPESKEAKFLESLKKYKKTSEDVPKPIIPSAAGTPIKQRSTGYIRLSNKFFRETSRKLYKKKYFENLNFELRKITSPYIITSFISMMFFTTVISFILGLFIFLITLFIGQAIIGLAMLIGLPLLTFMAFYLYPSNQRKTLEKEISQELPFVTIYLSAIATSGIEPSKIFRILVTTKDFPYTQREIKKLLNYINFYGYDFVSALKQVSRNNPSERFSILLNGMATTITSGGQLSQFLDKHAESLLFDYRLEREKYTKMSETLMDIYISVVIAAPMILMMLFILLMLTGFGGNFLTTSSLSIIVIFVITLLNLFFLFFIGMKQPKF